MLHSALASVRVKSVGLLYNKTIVSNPGETTMALEEGPGGDQSAARDTRLWHSQALMSAVRGRERLIARGEGAYVWDEDGNRLLDATASLWYCNVGHGRAEIADAVDAQMRRLEAYHCFQQFATRPAVELAERLAAMVPIDDARIYLTSGGGDSVEAAAKLARRFWDVVGRPEKRLIVTRELCYHGLHGFGTGIAGLDVNRTGQGELLADTERVATNEAEALARVVAEHGADAVAAFFCEPIIGAGGVVHPADGYLDQVQRICRENEILFVVDEVITGFGRTGEMFACERYGLAPDMMVMAKGVTSGYLPLGAVAIAEPVWAPFWEPGARPMFHHGDHLLGARERLCRGAGQPRHPRARGSGRPGGGARAAAGRSAGAVGVPSAGARGSRRGRPAGRDRAPRPGARRRRRRGAASTPA